MIRNAFGFVSLVLLMAAMTMLIFGCITSPVTEALHLAAVDNIHFGIFGYCNLNTSVCSSTSFGYQLESETSNFYFKKEATRLTFTKVLIAHIVGAGMSLIASFFTVLSLFQRLNRKRGLSIFLILIVVFAMLVSVLAYVIELILFLPHNNWPSHIAAGAIAAQFFAIIFLSVRDVSIARANKRERKVAAAVREVEEKTVYNEDEVSDANYPLTLDAKLNEAKATLPHFAARSNDQLSVPATRLDTASSISSLNVDHKGSADVVRESVIINSYSSSPDKHANVSLAGYEEFRDSDYSPTHTPQPTSSPFAMPNNASANAVNNKVSAPSTHSQNSTSVFAVPPQPSSRSAASAPRSRSPSNTGPRPLPNNHAFNPNSHPRGRPQNVQRPRGQMHPPPGRSPLNGTPNAAPNMRNASRGAPRPRPQRRVPPAQQQPPASFDQHPVTSSTLDALSGNADFELPTRKPYRPRAGMNNHGPY
ncbi:membrane anchored protein Mac1 [Schizosaccharomyces japonicus yFS275]|uniref:Membrane anchored protein Mac1 n=1 Tax=Schizosaccharomyces japonicus (strain yFS275 / FY16936) TaxID=402676 RepID=B6K5T2_SCHJY|nr:membrane anchored protein Mac1 [Schizosaccharomyces japonicus yFS275]EEB08886.1 membrane anchored protein Mac1 [Schizosaccharomyces japonicus yFS275]